MRALFERIRKWRALRGYKSNLPYLLRSRYGREPYYTPAQVLATIKEHGLSEPFAALACAMFCSKQGYAGFAARRGHETLGPVADGGVPWVGMDLSYWPTHHDVVVELHDSLGDSLQWTSSTDHGGYFSHHFGDGFWGDHAGGSSGDGFDPGGGGHSGGDGGGGHSGGDGGGGHSGGHY
jgi:hypothetical protein